MIGLKPLLVATFFILFIGDTFCSHSNYYYWREYTGIIPSDAIIAGKDIADNNLYIGQAYVKNGGWQVVPIYQGVKEAVAVLDGPRKIDRYIKILCGEQYNFNWVVTNEKNFHINLKDKNGVIGGHEDGWGDTHIGRISFEGETKIGKVNSFHVGQAKFYFHDSGVERRIDNNNPFEVLYYDETSVMEPRIDNTNVTK